VQPLSHSLRVVLVWRSTVIEEQTFTQTSPPRITVGEMDANLFSVSAPGLPDTFKMFERTEQGYVVRFTDRLEGSLSVDGQEWSFDELIEDSRAYRGERVRTARGDANTYEMRLKTGDWGLMRLGDVKVFFQLTVQDEAVAGRGLGSIEMPVLATVLLAAVFHVGFLIFAFLAFEANPSLDARAVSDRFVEVMVDDVPDPLEEQEDEQPSEETSGKRAGGEEGKVGDPDEEIVDTEMPKDDGEMVDEIDPTKIGVLETLSSDKLGSGPLAALFDDSQGIDSKIDVAMSGDGDELRVGRGTGGLSIRGTDRGGGGDDTHGRLQALGGVDTGGGANPSANVPKAKERHVPAKLEAEPPKLGDFCSSANIRKVVSAQSNAIKYCYERQLQQNPELSGKIIAQWKVGLDGTVVDASIAQSTVNDGAVESCITRVIGRMRFEKPDGGICVINYPFVFTGVK
jgi:hypothetical protein